MARAKTTTTKAATRSREIRTDTFLPETKVDKRLSFGDTVGEGGMGRICKALDVNLNRTVAVKELKDEHAKVEANQARLIEEAQITAQLDHPNIVPVYEIGVRKGNRVFFTMKLIRGRTLTSILDAKPPGERTAQDLFEAMQVFLRVCDAVAFAHARGVIHQDLKPDNVMVGEFGEVYLMDWGFAQVKRRAEDEELGKGKRRKTLRVSNREGMVATTIHYLAPEFKQGRDEAIDERTDIFCLGGVLYRVLTGRPPFHGASMQEVVQAALKGEVEPPEERAVADVPPRLSRIAMRAMAKEPADRYQSVEELKRDVEGFLQCGWQFERIHFPAGSLIVKEGDAGSTAYIVTTGRCRIFRTVDGRRQELGEIGVGDVFGELAVFAGQPRQATVEAIDDVSVMVLEKRHFEEDLGMSFWLGVVVKALADRFMDVSKQLEEARRG